MIKMLKNMSKKEIYLAIISIIFVAIQSWLELKIPDYMSEITKIVSTTGETSLVIHEGIIMILCALGSLVTAIIISFLSSFVGTSFEKNLRSKIFKKVQNYGMEEINKFSTSSLITRNTNDVTQVKNFVVMATQVLARAPITATIAIIKILGKEWEFSLITATGVLIVLIMVISLVKLVLPKFKVIQTLTDNINRITRENLTGIKVVRAFNAEEYQEKKFGKANKKLTDTNLFVSRTMAVMNPVIGGVMSGMSLAIYWMGATLINSIGVNDRIILFSDMVVFSSYAVQVVLSFMFLVVIFIIYPRASVSMKRISEILETKEKIKDGKKEFHTNIKGVVEFNNVSFKYPDAEEYILKDISFKVCEGETLAIIGGTGSGKTTLINLITRFYDATEGKILIDNINIKDIKLKDLYNKIGYIPQKAAIFKGTVKNNIKFGTSNNTNINDNEIWKYLEIAQAKDFVKLMNDKLNSNISQSGTNVSGGQKQRLSIARAIARNPEIYIFDDTFSALDFKTDLLLRKELNKFCKNATKIIVASRIGTIKDADKIIVLDNGNCVGIGRHEELLKTCTVYKEIAESQSWKGE